MDGIRINVPEKEIAEFCRKYHIRKLAFFGSVLRADFRSDSDVDVLVEFEPGHTPGFALVTIQDELSKLLDGRSVDLVTPKFLHARIRKQVEKDARVAYAQR
jgi:predicted nucleotidyltransferase